MTFEITLTDLGDESVESATVTEWLVKPGDHVGTGDDILELTTDKAAFTLASPQAGTVLECRVEAGGEVAPNDVLCVLDSE